MDQRKEKWKEVFAEEVNEGLSAPDKYLQSKYFYDKIGDELFIKIMHCDEYYLTNCELEIFKNQSSSLIQSFDIGTRPISIIELGAGDGLKTAFLLKEMVSQNLNFVYSPIDISKNAIHLLKQRLTTKIPGLKITGKVGDYFKILEEEQKSLNAQRIILFLGSNLGNLNQEKATSFLRQIASTMSNTDKLVIGLDLKKDPNTILAAYNDKQGYTRDFNLNILTRINQELGGNFDLEHFMHFPYYDPKLARAVSHLVSKKDQDVTISALKKTFHFKSWETIHTEISQKYDLDLLHKIIQPIGLTLQNVFYDQKKYFMNVVLNKV